MRKTKLFLIAAMTGMMMTGCGQEEQKPAETTTQVQESIEIKTDTEETSASETKDTEAAVGQEEEKTEETEKQETDQLYEDNFAVDGETVADFGKQVKEAVAAKDMEELADLVAFPTYVGFLEGGQSVESREQFLELGAEKIFTQELMDSVAAADETKLEPSMAGFVLAQESGAPNIIFGVRDGVLAISGINY